MRVFCIIIIIFFSTIQLNSQGIFYQFSQSEVDEINKFYYQCGGEDWSFNLSWPLTTDEFDRSKSFFGITLNYSEEIITDNEKKIVYKSSIKSIDLSNNKLSGNIPDFMLPELIYLDLSQNQLNGNLPDFNLPTLQVLKLSSNNLNGKIPSFNLLNLEELLLSNNVLSGELPDFNLSKLEYFSVNSNNIEGNIPDFNLPSLITLELANNKLSGGIPNFKLTKLSTLNLSNNDLSGNIPNFNLPNLNYLFLDNNNLNGEIPNFTLLNLRQLALNSNNLSGVIPEFYFPRIEYITLGFNQLSGNVPNLSWNKLQSIDLRNNKLSGFVENFIEPKYSIPFSSVLFLTHNNFTFETLESKIKQFSWITYELQDTILPLINANNSLEIITPGSANTYQWYRNENIIEDENFTTLDITKNGKYKCKVKNTLLPDLTLESEEIMVTNLGISESQKDNKIKIIQRGDELIIKYLGDDLGNDLVNQIKIYNTNGKIIYSSINLVKPINTSIMQSGVYFVNLEIGDEVISEKFIFSE